MSTNSSKVRRVASRTGLLFASSIGVGATVILAQIVIVIVIQFAKAVGFDIGTLQQAILSSIIALLTYALTLAIIAAYQRIRKHPLTLKLLGLHRLLRWKDIGLGLLAVVPYLVLTFIAMSLAAQLFQNFNESQAQDVGFDNLSTGYQYFLALLTLVALAPLAEEALFRGFLFGKLRSFSSFLPAAIFTSLTFGALHGQWNVGVDTFALSLVLCVLREKTGSIWAGVILHMLKNAVAFYFLFVAPSIPGTM